MSALSLSITPSMLESVVDHMLCPDAGIRHHAESFLNEALKEDHWEALYGSAIVLLRKSTMVHVRSYCAILLRKNLAVGEPVAFMRLSEQLQETIKSQLLEAVTVEGEAAVRHQICDAISELASICVFSSEGWLDLFKFLNACVHSDQVILRESALFLYGNIAKISSATLENHLQPLLEEMTRLVVDPDLNIRAMALQSSCSIISYLVDVAQKAPFHVLMPAFLSILVELIQSNSRHAEKSIRSLNDALVTVEAAFIRPYLQSFIPQMIHFASVSSDICKVSLEFLVIVAAKASGAARKSKEFVESTYDLAIKLLLFVEDEEDWDTSAEPLSTEYENTCFDCGLDAIHRLDEALGKKGLQTVMRRADEFLQSSDWKYRNAAVWSLSQSIEFMPFTGMKDFVARVLPFVNDPVSRVRFAAINFLGQGAADFIPQFQVEFHEVVIPILIRALDDPSERVQAHAAAALINFCEHCSQEAIKLYINPLLSKLHEKLKTGARQVQLQVITAIAMVAESAQDAFASFYQHFMPLLQQIIIHASATRDDRILRCRAIECFTLVGMAVPREVFLDDAESACKLFLQMYNDISTAEADDSTRGYIITAWGRLAFVLKERFLPYLEAIMPVALQMAALHCDVLEQDDDEADGEDEGKRYSFKTSVLQDKSGACNLLCALALELKQLFFPYVPATMDVLLPCISYVYSADVRSHSVAAMPCLISCSVLAFKEGKSDIAFIQSLFIAMCKEIINSFKIEEDGDILISMVVALTQVIEEVNGVLDQVLSADQLEIVGKSCFKLLLESKERVEKREALRVEPDFDEDAEDQLNIENEGDAELSTHTCQCFTALFKSQKERFLPIFAMIFPAVLTFLQSPHDDLRRIGLYIIVDVFEFCGSGSTPYFVHCISFLLEYTKSDNVSVRQPACYGLGICGKFSAAEVVAPYLNQMIQCLLNVISRPDAQEENAILCTDNALASISKIIAFKSQHINLDQVLPLWFNALPVMEDSTESPGVYMLLCDLFDANHPQIVQSDCFPKILFLAATYYKTDLFTTDVTRRMADVCKRILQSLSAPASFSLLQNLDQDLQAKLNQMLNEVQ